MMMRILKWLAIAVLAGFALVFMNTYHPDIPIAQLKEKYAYADSQFDSLLGMSVHYRIRGEGPTLLLLHGTAASLHTWEECTTALEKDFTVVSVDIPGFGLTGPHPEGDYSMTTYTDFIQAFSQRLSLDSFALAGNSLGGKIAWNYSLKYPEQVQQLILIDASGFANDRKDPISFRLAKNDFTAPLLKSITPKRLVRNSLLDVYAQDEKVSDALVQRYFDLLLRPGNRQAFIDRVRSARTDNTHLLPQLKGKPVLIIWGAEDTWIPVQHVERFKKALPNAEAAILEGVGHVPMEEEPTLVADLIRDFLTK
jgi:pimeloyl-ACP methyl ester carboxylesterase